jgi:hypothetical protein
MTTASSAGRSVCDTDALAGHSGIMLVEIHGPQRSAIDRYPHKRHGVASRIRPFARTRSRGLNLCEGLYHRFVAVSELELGFHCLCAGPMLSFNATNRPMRVAADLPRPGCHADEIMTMPTGGEAS